MGPLPATNERSACGVQHPNPLADIFLRRQTGCISNLDMDGRIETWRTGRHLAIPKISMEILVRCHGGSLSPRCFQVTQPVTSKSLGLETAWLCGYKLQATKLDMLWQFQPKWLRNFSSLTGPKGAQHVIEKLNLKSMNQTLSSFDIFLLSIFYMFLRIDVRFGLWLVRWTCVAEEQTPQCQNQICMYFQFFFGSRRLTCMSGRVWVNLSVIYACLCTFPVCSFAIFASRTSQSGQSCLLSTPAAVASATLSLPRTLARSQQSGHIPNSSDSINLQWKNTMEVPFTLAFQQSQWIQQISESNFSSAIAIRAFLPFPLPFGISGSTQAFAGPNWAAHKANK